jgi:hypothetical protein
MLSPILDALNPVLDAGGRVLADPSLHPVWHTMGQALALFYGVRDIVGL